MFVFKREVLSIKVQVHNELLDHRVLWLDHVFICSSYPLMSINNYFKWRLLERAILVTVSSSRQFQTVAEHSWQLSLKIGVTRFVEVNMGVYGSVIEVFHSKKEIWTVARTQYDLKDLYEDFAPASKDVVMYGFQWKLLL